MHLGGESEERSLLPPFGHDRSLLQLFKTGSHLLPLIAPLTRLAHKAIHTPQRRFSQQLTRNNIIKPLTKAWLFTRN